MKREKINQKMAMFKKQKESRTRSEHSCGKLREMKQWNEDLVATSTEN